MYRSHRLPSNHSLPNANAPSPAKKEKGVKVNIDKPATNKKKQTKKLQLQQIMGSKEDVGWICQRWLDKSLLHFMPSGFFSWPRRWKWQNAGCFHKIYRWEMGWFSRNSKKYLINMLRIISLVLRAPKALTPLWRGFSLMAMKWPDSKKQMLHGADQKGASDIYKLWLVC